MRQAVRFGTRWGSYGGLTEWLRSSPGKRVRCNSPVGSSPMSSARIQRPVSGLFFIEIYWNFMGKKWLFLMVRHPGNHKFPDYEKNSLDLDFLLLMSCTFVHEFPFFKIKQQAGNCFTRYLQRREKQFPDKQFFIFWGIVTSAAHGSWNIYSIELPIWLWKNQIWEFMTRADIWIERLIPN